MSESGDEPQPAGGLETPEPAAPADASPVPLEAVLTPVHGFIAYLAAVFLGVVFGALAFLLAPGGDGGELSTTALLFAAVASQAAILLATLWLTHASGARPRTALALRPVAWWVLPVAAIGMIGFSLAGDWLVGQLERLLGDPASSLHAIGAGLADLQGPALWGALAFFALAPAVAEEGLFRGFMHTAFANRWGPLAAVAVTSLLFAGLHLDLLQSPAALILGVYLGLLRVYTGSLYAPMAAHAGNNLLAAWALYLHGREGAEGALAQPEPLQVLVGVAIGLVALRLVAAAR